MNELQLDRIMETSDGKVRLAAALMAYAGLRVGEAAALRWQDIACSSDQVAITVPSKLGGVHRADAGTPLRAILAARMGNPRDLVIGWSAAEVVAALRDVMRAVGVDDSVHALRQYYASVQLAGTP